MSGLSQRQRLLAPALSPGDTVGIIAPASGFRRDEFEAGCGELARLGYKPYYLPSIFERDGYFAGSLQRRIDEFHRMFAHPEVKAILCARGGYGCNYLLPHVDIDLVRANPKIFGGCSDITSLLTYLCDATGLITFHAPMVAGDFARAEGYNQRSWMDAISRGESELASSIEEATPLVEGTAEGTLYGGCLSLLCASLGTPYEVRTAGTILFLEDRAERPYRIDRMLMQLKLAGKFEGVQGIVFGEMIDCHEPGSSNLTAEKVICRVLGELNIPIAFGLKSGHVSSEARTLPFGVLARLGVGSRIQLSYKAAVQGSSVPAQTI
jgi:muramoyltetrapeptide carboxypeptidase